jgi:hypothetical protein
MLILKVNGEKASCPVCWEEVTVRTYQRLKTEAKEGDHAVKVFAILTGTDFSRVWEAQAEDLEIAIYQATAFVFNSPEEFRTAPKPTYFYLDGKEILLPSNLGKLSVGQNFRMRQEMARAAKEGAPMESLLSIALSIYLQPIVDVAPFDMDRAKELEAQILDLNIFDVFPAAFFLLSRLRDSGNGGTGFLLLPLMRFWNGLQRWQKSRSLRRSAIYFLSTVTLLTTANCPDLSSKSPSMSSCPCSTHGRSVTNTTSDSQMQKNG